MIRYAAAILVSIVAAAQAAQPSAPAELRDRLTILAIENEGGATPAAIGRLLDYARPARGAGRPATRNLAITVLGRLERRDLIQPLFELLREEPVRRSASLALLFTLRAHARPPQQPADPEIEQAVSALIAGTDTAAVLGNLPYSGRDQVEAAESRLRALLEDSRADRAGAARGLEALARRNRRLAPLAEETVALLKKAARWELPAMRRLEDRAIVFNAAAALAAAGLLDAELTESVLGEADAETRRVAALSLAGAGSAVDAASRTDLIRTALRDRSAMVRYDGLRAWVRHETAAGGCGPITEALRDESLHVVLAAIDALADRCPADEALTGRLAAELRTPNERGNWQREAHALVAAASRAPDAAALAMSTFATHNQWQVRMYAARAAAILKDVATLERLAYDAHDNVREAALTPLRTLQGHESEAAFIAALSRNDHQLLLTSATALAGAPRSKYLLAALTAALERLTASGKDTSRDTRQALIARIREQGGADQVPLFERLLRDYDPEIAASAAAALQALTGRVHRPDPRPRRPEPPPTEEELKDRFVARVDLDNGRSFQIAFDKENAALAYARFARLIEARYFDGLTFHRVVPNFVIQGGSPGANEYEGDGPFMRDELSPVSHRRGTVGISTRGRHTGDAQIFVNLVDNPRLDFDYTVFGEVTGRGAMEVVDAIAEGTVIRRIRLVVPSR